MDVVIRLVHSKPGRDSSRTSASISTTSALPVDGPTHHDVDPKSSTPRQFWFLVVGLKAATLEALERFAIRECASGPVECNAAKPSGTV